MCINKKFDPKLFEKLKKPERLDNENPEIIRQNLSLREDSVFIDIGCGVGFAVVPFAKTLARGTVYACDISEDMLLQLESELAVAGVDNVKIVKMEEVKVPLADAIADAVLMQNLHHELDDAVENLLECKRLLKRGGRVAVVDWKPMETPVGPPLEIRVSEKKIKNDIEKAGFASVKTIDVFPYHSFVIAEKTTTERTQRKKSK